MGTKKSLNSKFLKSPGAAQGKPIGPDPEKDTIIFLQKCMKGNTEGLGCGGS